MAQCLFLYRGLTNFRHRTSFRTVVLLCNFWHSAYFLHLGLPLYLLVQYLFLYRGLTLTSGTVPILYRSLSLTSGTVPSFILWFYSVTAGTEPIFISWFNSVTADTVPEMGHNILRVSLLTIYGYFM